MSTNINPIRKVLILRFSSIGDIILTTPVIRALFNGKDVKVHFLLKEQFADILKGNPYLNKIHTFEKEPQEILDQLKSEQFDHIIDLHKNIRTKRLISELKRPSSHFPKLNVKKWVLVNFKMNRMPDIHIVDRYFKAGEVLNLINDHEGLDYFIPKEDQVDPSSYGLSKNGYLAVGIGAAHNTKRMPLEKMKELLAQLEERVVLLGGPKEKAFGDQLTKEKVINLAGKLNINQSASIIEQSRLVICPDTGIMHIAAALKKTIISIWGNTVPDFGMYPYFGKHQVRHLISEVKGLSCRPCSKIGFKACPKGHFKCMNEQNLKQISSFVDKTKGWNK